MSNDLGIDRSGNNNHWTVNNMTLADQMVDSPTNNFCTLNPLYWNPTRSNTGNYSEGNLKERHVEDCMVESTMAATTGKWYFEARTFGDNMFGWGATNKWGGDGPGYQDSLAVHSNGKFIANGSYIVNTGLAFNSGTHTIMMAVDLDNQRMWFGRNGTWYADPASAAGVSFSSYATLGDSMAVAARASNNSSNQYSHFNFGQDSSFAGALTAQGNQDSNDIGDFYYTPPTGFLALCTDNLPEPAVKPQEHFDVVTYTGTGSGQAVAVNFQPDFSWIKIRNASDGSVLSDAVRGATKFLQSTYNSSEADNSAFVSAFTSTGLTLGGNRGTSESGKTYVAWNWKANGSGSTNNSGDNNATVSANTDAKFSVVAYTGTGGEPKTVAHGLGVSPEMVIIKRRNGDGSWIVWHKDMADNYAFEGLDNDNAHVNGGSPISKYVDAVSSTLVTVGDAGENNNSGDTYIMYCWASVDGFCKVGSYVGNGNSDGPFAYTGFRPAFLLTKVTGLSGEGWQMVDSERIGYNGGNYHLEANSAGGDDDGVADRVDLLSNGFKIRHTWTRINSNAYTYIYLAFAENPFKYSNAR